MEFPCAPALADWSSASISQNPDTELFVMLSEKPALRPPSWRGWKTRPWITRLSGLMLSPSMAARGLENFISSLPDTPVSHSRPADCAAGGKIPATSGRMSHGSLERAVRNGSSAKTSRDIWTVDLKRLPETYRSWVTALKRACSQRLKSVRPTSGKGSSYWPTPTTSLYCCRVDILMGQDGFRFRTATDQKGSQHALGNTARVWTVFWELMKAAGLKPAQTPVYPSSRPLHVTLKPGTRTCPGDWTFNPNFSDWMMGWPIGWSDPAQPVTELSRWRQLMHTELSRLPTLV
jgi:hypothetical protein